MTQQARRASVLVLLLFLSGLAAGLRSQTVLTSLPSHILCPNDSVILPVQVSNFNNVSSISLSLIYDPLLVDFLGYQDVHSSLQNGLFLVNDIGTQIKIAWFSINPVFIGTGTMLKLRFRYLTGYGTLIWDTVSLGGCQYGNSTGATMPALFTGAYLSANGAVMQHPGYDTIMAGDTAIFGIQAFGSTLAYKWQENTGTGWVNVVNGLFYSGANSPQLKIQGPPQAFNAYQYRCRTTGTCPVPGDQFYSNPATLYVLPPCTTASVTAGSNDTICSGDIVSLQAFASNYTGLLWTGGDGVFSSTNQLNPTYTPGPGDIISGSVTLTLTAFSQSPCPSVQSSVQIVIQACPVNQPPQFILNGQAVNVYTFSLSFGQHLNFCLGMEDPENDPVSLGQVLQAPQYGFLSGIADGDTCAVYHPDLLFIGSDQFILTGCDTAGACDTAVVTVHVLLPPNNLAPMVLSAGLPADTLHQNVQMGTQASLCFDVFDPEGMPVDVAAVTRPTDHGQISGLGGGDTCVIFHPDTGYFGQDTLGLTICDTAGACDTIIVVLSVLDLSLPYPPQAVNDMFTGQEDMMLNCPVTFNDFDVNLDLLPSSLSLVQLPQHATVVADTFSGIISYSPESHFWGWDTFTYSICDSTGLCDTGVAMVFLAPVYDAPQVDTFYVLEDNVLQASVLDNDQFPYQQLDTSSLQITILPQHAVASVSFSAGKITYTPQADYFGIDSFVYRICDTSGSCGFGTVRIVIAPVNDAPRITHVNGTPHTWPSPILLSACTNSSLTWCFRLTDPEGEPGAIIGLSAPALPGALIVRLNDSCFSFQAPPGYSGTATLSLSVNDPYDTVSYPIYLTVHPDPVINAGADTLVCPGFPFIAVNASSSSASAWLWSSQGSGVFLNPNQLMSTYVPSNQDILQGFVVLRVIAWGLAPCLTRDTAFIRISFRNLPYVELGLDTTLCINYRISLDGGPGMAAYAWSTGGGARYELVDTSNLPYPGGPVSVTVTDVHGCVNDDQISITFVGCPGFAEYFKDTGLRMWPNPAVSNVWLASDGVVADSYVIRIVDMSGNIHWEGEFAGTGNPLYTELDVSALPSGIYLVQYVSKQKSQTLRLVVLH